MLLIAPNWGLVYKTGKIDQVGVSLMFEFTHSWSPASWSAVAAFGALATAVINGILAYYAARFSRRLRKSSHIKDIMNLWNSLNATVLSSTPDIKKIVGKFQFDNDDHEEVTKIYLAFMFINIAYALFYSKKNNLIDDDFHDSQITAVTRLLRRNEKLTLSLLNKQTGSYGDSFIEYFKKHMDADST
jgi:hypothetical protein